MALYKTIIQDDGVPTSYHRILLLMKTINRQNSIAVLSYVDGNARDNEKDSTLAQPYCKNITYELPYDEGMTVEDAYSYLKTLPLFEGAEDI